MKKLFVIILLTSFLNANFFEEDDKQKHMQVTFAIGFVFSGMAYDLGYTETESFWIGVAVAMGAGIGKELYDSRNGGTGFDMADIGADAIGAVSGSLPVFVIYEW